MGIGAGATAGAAAALEGVGAGWVEGASDALGAGGLQASAASSSHGAQGEDQRGSVESTRALYQDPEHGDTKRCGSVLRFQAARFVPQGVEIDGEALATRFGREETIHGAQGFHIPPVGAQLENLQAAQGRIDNPVEPDAEGGILVRLLDAIALRRAPVSSASTRWPSTSSPGSSSSMSAQAASVISGPPDCSARCCIAGQSSVFLGMRGSTCRVRDGGRQTRVISRGIAPRGRPGLVVDAVDGVQGCLGWPGGAVEGTPGLPGAARRAVGRAFELPRGAGARGQPGIELRRGAWVHGRPRRGADRGRSGARSTAAHGLKLMTRRACSA